METKSKQLLRSLRGFIPALADSLGPKLDERRCKAEFHAGVRGAVDRGCPVAERQIQTLEERLLSCASTQRNLCAHANRWYIQAVVLADLPPELWAKRMAWFLREGMVPVRVRTEAERDAEPEGETFEAGA